MDLLKKSFIHVTNITLFFSGCFFIYCGLGAFLGTLRTDEIYFLTTATWLLEGYRPTVDYNGSFYVLFRYLITGYFLASGENYAGLWGIRLINLMLSIVQCCFIYTIWFEALRRWTNSANLISLFLVTVYFALMASFRGYEIRPEILPITLLLFGVYVSMKLSTSVALVNRDWLLIVTSLVGLVLAGSISIRVALPSACIFALIAIQAFQKRGSAHNGFWLMAICLPLLIGVLINGVWINLYGLYLIGQNESAYHPHFDLLLKLTIGENSFLFLAIKLGLWALILVIFLGRSQHLQLKLLLHLHPIFLALLFSLISFYLFLEVFDFRPFEYVRAIEWSLLTAITPFALRVLIPNQSYKNERQKVTIIILIIALAIGFLSAKNLLVNRNTNQVVDDLLSSKSMHALQLMNDKDLIHHLITGSLLEQLWARQTYCQRYPKGQAVVADWSTHPICMKDAGSLLYSGWSGNLPFSELHLENLYYINLANHDRIMSTYLKSDFELTDGIWYKLFPQPPN